MDVKTIKTRVECTHCSWFGRIEHCDFDDNFVAECPECCEDVKEIKEEDIQKKATVLRVSIETFKQTLGRIPENEGEFDRFVGLYYDAIHEIIPDFVVVEAKVREMWEDEA